MRVNSIQRSLTSLETLEIIIFAVCVTFILVRGSIFSWLQAQGEFFKCPLCLGFWVGLLCTAFYSVCYGYAGNHTLIVTMFRNACLTSVSSYVLYLLIENLE